MTKHDDGGPAFPMVLRNGEAWVNGMTLLDWFAGRALAGILAGPNEGATFNVLVHQAYDMAAAMVAEKRRRGRG